MPEKIKRQPKGFYNSSLTRVYPLFEHLIQRDPTGRSWLPDILQLAMDANPSALSFPKSPGSLLPAVVARRKISGKTLGYPGVEHIELPACFEKSIPSSYRFLRWLIEHPGELTWPLNGKQRYGWTTQKNREELFGWHGADRQAAAQKRALAELEQHGAARAQRKWWAFEGATSVDCCLETENLLLLIEGKRTETLSASVSWYPGRNQLVRNLEVAQEMAGGKQFAVLVIAEEIIPPPLQQAIDDSLPHFSPQERQTLMRHSLGCITWQQVCRAVDIPYASLPHTAPGWIASL